MAFDTLTHCGEVHGLLDVLRVVRDLKDTEELLYRGTVIQEVRDLKDTEELLYRKSGT